MAAFRCGLNTSHLPYFKCMSGGVCAWDASNKVEFCLCKEGWMHDYVGFGHFANCSLPKWYLLVFFITYSVIFWPLFFQLLWKFVSFKSRGRVRSVISRAMAFSFSSWLHCLCVFIETGFYAASLVSLGLITITGFDLAHFCGLLVLEPILRRAGLRDFEYTVRPLLKKLTLTLYLIVIGFIAAMLVYCRKHDNILYNRLMLSFISFIVVILILTTGVITLAASRIWQLMPREAVTLSRQLRTIIMVAGANLTAALGTLAILIVWGIFSSFPYLYIQWSICQVLVLIMLSSIGPLLAGGKAGRTGETTRKSSSQRHEGSDEMGNPSVDLTDGPSFFTVKGLGIRNSRLRKKNGTKPIKTLTRITEIEELERGMSSEGERSRFEGSENQEESSFDQ